MGSKGGSTQQTSNTGGTSSTQLPPWLTGAAQQAVGTAQTLSQNPNLFDPYSGQQVAPQSGLTTAAYNQIQSPYTQGTTIGNTAGEIYNAMLPATAGQQQAVYGGLNQAQQSIANAQGNAAGLLGQFTGLGPATAAQVAQNAQTLMTPYTQQVIDPVRQMGQQALAQNLQQVGANANQAGAFGGSRQGVMEGVAQAQQALGESAQIGQLLNTGWNAALTPATNIALQGGQESYGAGNTLAQLAGQGGQTLAQLQAQGGQALGGYAQGQMMGALQGAEPLQQQYLQNLLGTGSQQQAQQQAEMNAQIGNYYQQQQQPIQNLDLLISAITGVPYGTTSQMTGTGAGGQMTNPGVMNEITGGVGALGGLAGGIGSLVTAFSDRRLKTDINQVGETEGGTPVHTFRYKGDPSGRTHMGVIAQQLAMRQPEAVRRTPSGLLAVDYSQVK